MVLVSLQAHAAPTLSPHFARRAQFPGNILWSRLRQPASFADAAILATNAYPVDSLALLKLCECISWFPKTATCNFELALINAIQGLFPFTKINGCLFHWKQAIWRKLVSLKFSNEKEILEIAMHRFSIDILTVIPVNEIKKRGSCLWRTIWKTH